MDSQSKALEQEHIFKSWSLLYSVLCLNKKHGFGRQVEANWKFRTQQKVIFLEMEVFAM